MGVVIKYVKNDGRLQRKLSEISELIIKQEKVLQNVAEADNKLSLQNWMVEVSNTDQKKDGS